MINKISRMANFQMAYKIGFFIVSKEKGPFDFSLKVFSIIVYENYKHLENNPLKLI